MILPSSIKSLILISQHIILPSTHISIHPLIPPFSPSFDLFIQIFISMHPSNPFKTFIHSSSYQFIYRVRTIRPGFLAGKLCLLAGNSIYQHCIHSKLQNEPQRGYKETNVVHFSHCYRLNFDKPYDTLFIEAVQLKLV